MNARRWLLSACLAMIATGCAGKDARPIPPVAKVDLPRFMGDWYVIANIPTFPERNAYAATESYALKPDGRVQTTYRYRKGSFDAPVKTMHPVGTVRPGTGNAVWGMQFIWPIKAEYVIAYLAPDYSQTIIARNDRDYAWVMARTPAIPEDEYQQHMQRLHKWGYDIGKVRRVPQQPPGDGTSPARP